MEDDRVGRRAATRYRPDHLSPACVATRLTLAEQCGGGLARRVKERFGISVWTTRGKSGRVRVRRLHTRVPGPSGSDLLRGIHGDALPLACIASVRATLRDTLPSHDED